jgi:hypothetical protein
MAKVFFSYSHDDEAYRDQLEKHLAALKHEGMIESWHDRRILAGSEIDSTIDQQIDQADVILLLVSSSFISSHYCYSVEMQRALQRHAGGECRVIPVIVRPCDWSSTPIGKLLAAPRDGKAVTTWPNYDEAYADIAKQIRAVVKDVDSRKQKQTIANSHTSNFSSNMVGAALVEPRSSNLRLRKTFTDLEKDQFAHETFDFVARFFDATLRELQERNPGIQGVFRLVTANRFTAAVYNQGSIVSECAIALGDGYGRGAITYSSQASSTNSYNEMLNIECDDQSMYFKSLMGMHQRGVGKLSQEGVAELLWAKLIERLQR